MSEYKIRNELLRAFIEGIEANDISTEDALRLVADAEKHIKKRDEPAWNPEDLIGKLVKCENAIGKLSVGILEEVVVSQVAHDNLPESYLYIVRGPCLEAVPIIRPLTEAEALALVYRKPGSLICSNCHRETTVSIADLGNGTTYSQVHAICTLCGAPWNPPVTERRPS